LIEGDDGETITKIDAAERQIRTAIRMFFEDDDVVSIITLARAGSEVLRDIGNTRGIPDEMGLDSLSVNEEYRKDWIDALRKPQNFFKHGSRKPEEVLRLKPFVAHYMLLNAVALLRSVAGKIPRRRDSTISGSSRTTRD
jgi:hypothetical protein